MTLDFETDQTCIDNLEAVTYTSIATIGNTAVAILDAAFYRAAGLGEGSPSQGVYVKALGRFSIRPSLLAAVGGVKPADTITRTDGSIWTVLRAVTPSVSVYQIDVIDLILSNGLQQSGTLLRPLTTKDAAGRQALGPYAGYNVIATGIPCRLQPITGDVTDVFDRKSVVQKWTAIIGTQLTASAKDVFSVDNVTFYTVLGFKNPQRIDELQTLSLELVA
jgi:hypothetical protein